MSETARETLLGQIRYFSQTGLWSLEPEAVQLGCQEFGFKHLDQLSSMTVTGLKKWTHNARRDSLVDVMGEEVFGRYNHFIDYIVAPKYEGLMQPTEVAGTGSERVGSRRVLPDILCYGYGCMNPDLFMLHMRLARKNGIEYGLHKDQGSFGTMVTPTSRGEPVRPASFPKGYLVDLSDFLEELRI